MKVEQFVYALFKHHGMKLLKSPSLNKLVNGDIIDFLRKLPSGNSKLYLWPNGVVTYTLVRDVVDEYGRGEVYNHTVAVKVTDVLSYMQLEKLFFPLLKCNLSEAPERLETIEVEECQSQNGS